MSKSTIETLTLFNVDESTFKVPLYTRVTPNMYAKITGITSAGDARGKDVLLKNKAAFMVEMESDPEKKRAMIAENYEAYVGATTEAEKLSKEIEFEVTMQIAQAIIDTRTLSDEQRLLIESDTTSDFWINQDYAALKVAADSFLRRYRS